MRLSGAEVKESYVALHTNGRGTAEKQALGVPGAYRTASLRRPAGALSGVCPEAPVPGGEEVPIETGASLPVRLPERLLTRYTRTTFL